MITMIKQPRSAKPIATDEGRWQAVVDRDKSAAGRFFYAVRTTGVYCRPDCASRPARRENVEFFQTPADAERAGFRACKRCKPNAVTAGSEHADAVARACNLIAQAADDTPNVQALADAVGISPSHFHRVFKSLTGLTPKSYAIARRAQRVRKALSTNDSVTTAIYDAGFRSNGRFYETSTQVLGMTPTTFRAGGKGATIRFAVGECSLGSILVAASQVGVCSIMLGDEPDTLVEQLQDRFAKAELIGGNREFEKLVAKVIGFVEQPAKGLQLPLEVRGTAFQHRVWKALREIPCGTTRSYSQLATELGKPNATRAVGQACAANPIAVAIPCHRVVRTDGSLSGYRWGIQRKATMLARERAQR